MVDRVRSFDWSATPVGPPDRWPRSLRGAVDLCLHSRFPMMIWWGPDLTMVYNDAYAPMLGKRHPAALGRSGRDVWAEIWPEIEANVRAVVDRGESTFNDTVRLVMERNGYPEETWFTYGYSPILNDDGTVGGLFNACREETARVLAERDRDRLAFELADAKLRTDLIALQRLTADREALLVRERTLRAEAEHAGRMKDEFLANLSHELRTPLSAILGWAQILNLGGADGGADAETLAEGVQAIERNARAQTRIIDDLLDMSRIISGKVSINAGRIDLRAVVDAAVGTVRPAAAAKGIAVRLTTAAADGRHPVLADPNRLQQVFWNLLSNAVKFTPKGGEVRVHLDRGDGRTQSQWRATVTDTGEGIEAEFLPFVFDRFRQADASTTRRHGGLGLGLAIVKQLVELHGGSVAVHSGGRGTGSTFTVALPMSLAHHDLPHPGPTVPPPAASTRPLPPPGRPRCGRLGGRLRRAVGRGQGRDRRRRAGRAGGPGRASWPGAG